MKKAIAVLRCTYVSQREVYVTSNHGPAPLQVKIVCHHHVSGPKLGLPTVYRNNQLKISAVMSPTISVANTSVAETKGLNLTTGELAVIESKFSVPNGTSSVNLVFSITPIQSDGHDTLEVLDAIVAGLTDITVSGSQAIKRSLNSTTITWTFPMLINLDSADGINDTIQVQAVVVSTADDVLQLKNPQVTIEVYADIDNTTILGSSVKFQLVVPQLIASISMSLNSSNTSILIVTARVFHSNVSTAVAKNVVLSIPLPSSVDIQESDIDVSVTPEGLNNPLVNVTATRNTTTLILDIGNLPLTAVVTMKFAISTTSVMQDLGNGGIIPIIAYSSIDHSDQRISGFTGAYPTHLVQSTTRQTQGGSSCIRKITVYVEETDWTYDIAIIGCCIGFIGAAIITLLVFCYVCRKQRRIPYNIFVRTELVPDDEESYCQRSCCFTSHQSWRVNSVDHTSSSRESLLRNEDQESHCICWGFCCQTRYQSVKAERGEDNILGHNVTKVSPTNSQSIRVPQKRYPTPPVVHSNSEFSLVISGTDKEDRTATAFSSSEISCRTTSRASNIKQAWRGVSLEQPDNANGSIDAVSNDRLVTSGLDHANVGQGPEIVTEVTSTTAPKKHETENHNGKWSNRKLEATYTKHQAQSPAHRAGSLVPVECRTSVSDDDGSVKQNPTNVKVVPVMLLSNDANDDVFDTNDGDKTVACPNSRQSILGDELSLNDRKSKGDKKFEPKHPGDLLGSDRRISLQVGELHDSFEGRPLLIKDSQSPVGKVTTEINETTDTTVQQDDSEPDLAARTMEGVVIPADVTADSDFSLGDNKNKKDGKQGDGTGILLERDESLLLGGTSLSPHGNTPKGKVPFAVHTSQTTVARALQIADIVARLNFGPHVDETVLDGKAVANERLSENSVQMDKDWQLNAHTNGQYHGMDGSEFGDIDVKRTGNSMSGIVVGGKGNISTSPKVGIHQDVIGSVQPLEDHLNEPPSNTGPISANQERDVESLSEGTNCPVSVGTGQLDNGKKRRSVGGAESSKPSPKAVRKQKNNARSVVNSRQKSDSKNNSEKPPSNAGPGSDHDKKRSLPAACDSCDADIPSTMNIAHDHDRLAGLDNSKNREKQECGAHDPVLTTKHGEHTAISGVSDDNSCRALSANPTSGASPEPQNGQTGSSLPNSSKKQRLSDHNNDHDKRRHPPTVDDKAKTGQPLMHSEQGNLPTGSKREHGTYSPLLVGPVKVNAVSPSIGNKHGKPEQSPGNVDKGHLDSYKQVGNSDHDDGDPLPTARNRNVLLESGVGETGQVPPHSSEKQPSNDHGKDRNKRRRTPTGHDKDQTGRTLMSYGQGDLPTGDNREHDKYSPSPVDRERGNADRPSQLSIGRKHDKSERSPRDTDKGHLDSSKPIGNSNHNDCGPLTAAGIGDEPRVGQIGRLPPHSSEKQPETTDHSKGHDKSRHSPTDKDTDKADQNLSGRGGFPSGGKDEHGKCSPLPVNRDKGNADAPSKRSVGNKHDRPKRSQKDISKGHLESSKPVSDSDHNNSGPLHTARNRGIPFEPQIGQTGRLLPHSSEKPPLTTDHRKDHDKHHRPATVEKDTGQTLMHNGKGDLSTGGKREHDKDSTSPVDGDKRNGASSKLSIGKEHSRSDLAPRDNHRAHPSEVKLRTKGDSHRPVSASKPKETVESSKPVHEVGHDNHSSLLADGKKVNFSVPGRLHSDSNVGHSFKAGNTENHGKHHSVQGVPLKSGYKGDNTLLPKKDKDNELGSHKRENPKETSSNGGFGLPQEYRPENTDQHGSISGEPGKGNDDEVHTSSSSPNPNGMTGRILAVKHMETRDGDKEHFTTGDAALNRNDATDGFICGGAYPPREPEEVPVTSQLPTRDSVSDLSQVGPGDEDAQDISDLSSSSASGKARVALKRRRKKKEDIPVGILSPTVMSMEGVQHESETILSDAQQSDNMTTPTGNGDNSRGNSTLGLIKKKIVSLFRRSESIMPIKSKSQTVDMTPEIDSSTCSGEDTQNESESTEGEADIDEEEGDDEGKGENGEEKAQDEQLMPLSRAEVASPTLPKQRIVLPEWEIIISWLRSNPDEQQQELLSFDFLISMRLDGELEQEISDMYIQLLVWFIQKLQMVGSLTTEQEAKLLVRFRFLMIQLTRKLTREKKLKFIEVARGLARRHKRQRNELEIKHYQERFQRSMKVEKEEGGLNTGPREDHDKGRRSPTVRDKDANRAGHSPMHSGERDLPTGSSREHAKYSPLPVDREKGNVDAPSKQNTGNKNERRERSPKDFEKSRLDSSQPVGDSDHNDCGPLTTAGIADEPRVGQIGRLPPHSSEKQPVQH
jgi:hypothetical protein